MVSMVYTLRTMKTAFRKLQYYTRKAPLSKRTKEQLTAGYHALQEVAYLAEKG